ncbi:MAG: hypothetical protein ACFE68_01785 [Candidatus Hodarchaeota archaeon]
MVHPTTPSSTSHTPSSFSVPARDDVKSFFLTSIVIFISTGSRIVDKFPKGGKDDWFLV